MIDSIRLVARDTSLIGSLATSSRNLRLYSFSCRCRFTCLLIVVAAHVQLRENVAYSADLEQMWVEIPSERGLPLRVMLADLSDALFCLLCIGTFCHATQCNATQRVLRGQLSEVLCRSAPSLHMVSYLLMETSLDETFTSRQRCWRQPYDWRFV